MNLHTASFYASAATGLSKALQISSWLTSGRFAYRKQRSPETCTFRFPASCLLATTPTRCTLANAMDPSSDIILDTPFFRIYGDRRIDRLVGTAIVPAGFDPTTGVTSKDVVIDSDAGIYVRLYLPDTATGAEDSKKLPVLVYFHGGGFVTHSAASPPYQPFLNTLAEKAGVLIVSVNYRLAPEHPLPAGYEDSFGALKWAASGSGDPWLSRHGNMGRIFLAGDSSGGNFVHNVAMMAAASSEVRIEGAVLLHAAFSGKERIDGEKPESVALTEKLWGIVCLDSTDGVDNPRMNLLAAAAALSLRNLPCERVLVCAAELDNLRARNRAYYEALAASGWGGTAEWLESKGKQHVFFLYNPGCDEAVELMDRLVAFFAGNGNSSCVDVTTTASCETDGATEESKMQLIVESNN